MNILEYVSAWCTPHVYEIVVSLIAFITFHYWLKQDHLLYKRVLMYALFFGIAYSLGCSTLCAVLAHLSPALLVLAFLLHYRTLARFHRPASYVFASHVRTREMWINDLLKAHMYGYYSGKQIKSFLVKGEAASVLFNQDVVMHAPLTHTLLILLVNGAESHLNLMIDQAGHLRSLSSHAWTTIPAFSKEVVNLEFEGSTKTFTLLYANQEVKFLSLVQTASLLGAILDGRMTPEIDSVFFNQTQAFNSLSRE